MITAGIALLIIGIVIVVVSALTPVPAPIGQLGWVALVLGIVLFLLGYLLPVLDTAPAAMLLR